MALIGQAALMLERMCRRYTIAKNSNRVVFEVGQRVDQAFPACAVDFLYGRVRSLRVSQRRRDVSGFEV